jgi:hypothetical protein
VVYSRNIDGECKCQFKLIRGRAGLEGKADGNRLYEQEVPRRRRRVVNL